MSYLNISAAEINFHGWGWVAGSTDTKAIAVPNWSWGLPQLHTSSCSLVWIYNKKLLERLELFAGLTDRLQINSRQVTDTSQH